MKDNTPTPDHATFEEYTYAWFHFKMIGKQFIDREGIIKSKLDVFIEFRKSPAIMRMIVNGSFKELTVVDKPGWIEGMLVDKRSFTRSFDGSMKLVYR